MSVSQHQYVVGGSVGWMVASRLMLLGGGVVFLISARHARRVVSGANESCQSHVNMSDVVWTS